MEVRSVHAKMTAAPPPLELTSFSSSLSALAAAPTSPFLWNGASVTGPADAFVNLLFWPWGLF